MLRVSQKFFVSFQKILCNKKVTKINDFSLISFFFRPDTSSKFLQRHNLTTLVRSHECKHDGYEIVHNGNVS